MGKLSDIGRIFYGMSIAVLGFQTIYYKDFPYMLIPPKHSWIPGLVPLAYISGAMLMLAGICIVFRKKIVPVSILLGIGLLLVFCFYFIPYQFMTNSNYKHFGEWENAEKEVALSGGAFILAGCFSAKNKSSFTGFLTMLIPLGTVLFSIPIVCFGISHFLYAQDVADYVPSWIPFRTFWAYFAGAALLGSGIAIILKIKPGLVATLLGTMIFTWFIILHIPRVIVSPAIYMKSEVTSAFIALAYSGIAYVIAGAATKQAFKR